MSRLNTFLKDFKSNVRFDPEITVCHMSDIVLDKKLQMKTKMCLLIKVFENKQFSLSHTSATFWMLLTKKALQAVESSYIPWSDSCPELLPDTADGLFTERCKEMVGDSNHHVTLEFVFATHTKKFRPENQLYSCSNRLKSLCAVHVVILWIVFVFTWSKEGKQTFLTSGAGCRSY